MRRLASALWFGAVPLCAQFEFFETRIRPVLASQCYSCHGPEKASGGLRLDSKAALLAGGSRGTALIAGNPESSLILKALSHRDPALKMPPAGKLPDTVIEGFREWIRHGAEDPREEAVSMAPQVAIDWDRARRHWSFQPIRSVAPPPTAGRTSIDRFIRARLDAAGLTPVAPASKAVLLRRASYDLLGLPPSPDELRAFLADPSPRSFEHAVDRMLASPHYGERWARHWLDLVRFAETGGHEFDFYRYEAWRYRDYVIRAFNQDLPYNRFVTEHIAGDLLPRHEQRLAQAAGHWDTPIGAGYLGLGEERNGATDLEEVRTELRDSRIDVFGKAFLGLTIACARCHDHKFDPITTADYYALGGIFDSARTTLGSVASPAVLERTEAALARHPAPPAPQPKPLALRPGDELLALDGFHVSGSAFAHPAPGLLDSSRGRSNRLTGIMISRGFVPVHRYIHVLVAGTKFNPVREEPSLLGVTIFAPGRYPKGVAGSGDRRLRWKTITLKEEINQICHLEIADRLHDGHLAVRAIVMSNVKEPPPDPEETLAALAGSPELEAALPVEPFARVTYEDVPRDLRIQIRGSHHSPGALTGRRFLQLFDSKPEDYRDGSGRLKLSTDLTEGNNPLLARVLVNRVWKHHFGEGLTSTVDNFGRTGERPSHPELLDYLAHGFIEDGWSLKRLHRRIVLSDTYRQSSEESSQAAALDPSNRLLSHMSVRRLDAESIRDGILAVAGSLDGGALGPSVRPHIAPNQDGRGKPDSGPLDGNGRRSVYFEIRRNFLPAMLLAFDYPSPTSTAGKRGVSTVPAQALALMNNPFVTRQASNWARRATAAESDTGKRLDAMFQAAYARLPEPAERDGILTFLHNGGAWDEVAHVLLTAAEFYFVR